MIAVTSNNVVAVTKFLQNNFLHFLLLTFLLVPFIFFSVYRANYENISLHSYHSTDQEAYIDEAQHLVESGYRLFWQIERNRMPIFISLISVVYDQNDEIFFENAKLFSILLSTICLIILYRVFQKYLPLYAVYSLLAVITYTVFVYRSPYVQSELLYYTLFFLSFLGMVEMLHRPSKKTAFFTGVVTALAYLTKASIPLLFVIFLFWYVVKLLTNYLKHHQIPRREIVCLIVLIVTTLAITFPYLLHSKTRFGSFFYNYSKTFYMWIDKSEEFENLVIDQDLFDNYPQIPEENSPSLQKYLRKHSAAQMIERVREGATRTLDYIFKS